MTTSPTPAFTPEQIEETARLLFAAKKQCGFACDGWDKASTTERMWAEAQARAVLTRTAADHVALQERLERALMRERETDAAFRLAVKENDGYCPGCSLMLDEKFDHDLGTIWGHGEGCPFASFWPTKQEDAAPSQPSPLPVDVQRVVEALKVLLQFCDEHASPCSPDNADEYDDTRDEARLALAALTTEATTPQGGTT